MIQATLDALERINSLSRMGLQLVVWLVCAAAKISPLFGVFWQLSAIFWRDGTIFQLFDDVSESFRSSFFSSEPQTRSSTIPSTSLTTLAVRLPCLSRRPPSWQNRWAVDA
jgi:hypothetical protein